MNRSIFGFDWLPSLGAHVVELAIKSLLLMIIVTALVALFRRGSAATRHCIWTLGLVATLCLPLLNWCLPNVAVPGVPALNALNEADTFVAAAYHNDLPLPQPLKQSPGGAQRSLSQVPASSEQAMPAEVAAEGRHSHTSLTLASPQASIPAVPIGGEGHSLERTQTATTHLLSSIAICWLLVAGVLLTRLSRSWWAARRLAGQAVHVDLSELSDDLLDIHKDAQVLLAKRVFIAAEPMSPYVVGLLKTRIVLPQAGLQWSRDRLAAVLRHELAHIQRNDLLSQFIAKLASALFWFNPFIWIAETKLRLERELACDDLASQAGLSAHGYAQHLLDVARLHSRPQAALAISMVRPPDIERRITSLLDPSKCRLQVSRLQVTGFISLVALVGFIIAVVVPAGSEAVADPPTMETRTVRVRVQDADGKPLPGAQIHCSALTAHPNDALRFVWRNSDYQTDENGIAKVSVPRKLQILRLRAKLPQYVPMLIGWEEDQQGDKEIPDEYCFSLEPGTQVGGKVIDESGKPIAGVRVNVRVKPLNSEASTNGAARVPTRLAEEDTVLTDEQGNWLIDNAPADGKNQYTFSTGLVHHDFVSDDNWGQTQERCSIKTEQLRDLSAVFRMLKGTPIKGRVTLPNGQPAIEGIVVWNVSPYRISGSQECEVQADGTFTTAALSEGEHPLTVVVPGYSPWFQQVRVYRDMGSVDIQLEPGNPITIRVQDANGNPIPRAYASVRGWKQIEDLYNIEHSNALPSGIPNRADDEGVYRWTWAPADGVKYNISHPNYSDREVTLSASPKEHVITLEPAMQIAVKVTDKTTGQPIPLFDVIPVHIFPSGWMSAAEVNAKVGRNGQYVLDGGAVSQREHTYRVRIEADGYRSAMSQVDMAIPARYEVDFQLEPAAPLIGNAVLPDGQPAAGADVQFATPTIVPHVSNYTLEDSRLVRTTTDDQGQFIWRVPFEPLLVRVIHPQGFAEVDIAINQPIGTIHLQPWASVQGRLAQAGKPIANEEISFWPLDRRNAEQPRFQDSYSAKTDADGYFQFERLPPVAGSLRAYLGPWEDSPLQSSQAVPLDLKPGDAHNVELGAGGAHITGQVVPTGRGGVELDENYSLNYLISRRPGIAVPSDLLPPEFDASKPLDESTLSTLSGNPWLHAKENYFVKLSPEGDLNVHGVPAGEYDLVIQLFERPAGCLVESIGQRVIPVTVRPSDVASGSSELGRIEVPCRVGPRIGSNMDIYAFTDATGRETTIAEVRGKYVVLQFWATWCGPCVESMQQLQSQIGQFHHDKLTIAAINVDADPRDGKRFATAKGFTWANDFIGAKSVIAQQLAISSVPSYFLIDDQGKLAATATSWDAIEKELKQRELVN